MRQGKPYCIFCNSPMERSGTCENCKEFNRHLRDVVGYHTSATRAPDVQSAIEANIIKYTERAARRVPLFEE